MPTLNYAHSGAENGSFALFEVNGVLLLLPKFPSVSAPLLGHLFVISQLLSPFRSFASTPSPTRFVRGRGVRAGLSY